MKSIGSGSLELLIYKVLIELDREMCYVTSRKRWIVVDVMVDAVT